MGREPLVLVSFSMGKLSNMSPGGRQKRTAAKLKLKSKVGARRRPTPRGQTRVEALESLERTEHRRNLVVERNMRLQSWELRVCIFQHLAPPEKREMRLGWCCRAGRLGLLQRYGNLMDRNRRWNRHGHLEWYLDWDASHGSRVVLGNEFLSREHVHGRIFWLDKCLGCAVHLGLAMRLLHELVVQVINGPDARGQRPLIRVIRVNRIGRGW